VQGHPEIKDSQLLKYRFGPYQDQEDPSFTPIEEGRAASKSPHSTFGFFLSTSQQEVSADIIKTSAPQKQKEQRQKQLDVF
jgi:hypothetical protein